MKENLQWILLDLDNTLVASHPLRLKIKFLFFYFRECRKRGLSVLQTWRLLSTMQTSLQAQGKRTNLERVASAVAPILSSTQIQHLLEQIFFAMKDEFSAIETAYESVQKLKQKYRLVLATNPIWPLAVSHLRLAIVGLKPEDFVLLTHNENMCTIKPNPNYYREVLEKINAKAEECLMLGDNPRKDGPAQSVGIRTIIVSKKIPLLQQIQELLL